MHIKLYILCRPAFDTYSIYPVNIVTQNAKSPYIGRPHKNSFEYVYMERSRIRRLDNIRRYENISDPDKQMTENRHVWSNRHGGSGRNTLGHTARLGGEEEKDRQDMHGDVFKLQSMVSPCMHCH